MGFQISIFVFLSTILLQLLGSTIGQIEFIQHYCNFGYNANYTSNSLFKKNLDTLPSFLTSESSFYNFTIGEVNVIGLCRGDVKPDICRSCLKDSNTKLREACPREKESIGWSDNCMLRYSDRPIFNNVTTLPNAYAYNLKMANNVKQFNKVMTSLLDSLSDKASGGDSVIKFATGNMSLGLNDVMIYGLVQCTPDLSLKQCKYCLNMSFGYLPQCCDGKIGGRVVMPSCNFRYEIGSFYNQTLHEAVTPPPQPTQTTPPSNVHAPSLSQPSNGEGGTDIASLITLSAIIAAPAIFFYY